MSAISEEILTQIGEILLRLRSESPHIHAMTNPVAQVISANALLALGLSPSMTSDRDESADFIRHAKAALVNLGMLDSVRRDALEGSSFLFEKWVLDPVKIDISLRRLSLAQKLIKSNPTIIKLNVGEASMLFYGKKPSEYAFENKLVVAITGAQDVVSDGIRTCTILNGHPFMSQSTAIGCTAGAIITACLAVEKSAYLATIAGLVITGVAGEIGAQNAKGPGTFVSAFIDALFHLTPEMIKEKGRIA